MMVLVCPARTRRASYERATVLHPKSVTQKRRSHEDLVGLTVGVPGSACLVQRRMPKRASRRVSIFAA